MVCGQQKQEITEKYEKEISVNQDDFPEKALKLAAPILKNSKKTRFYKEINANGTFYEFKCRYRGEYISVKFNERGQLVDIEILRKLEDFPEEVQTAIQQYFKENYEKYQFNRIQIQYNREEEYEDGELEIDDDEEYLEEFLELDLEDLIIKYEIEAETVDPSNKRGFFEFLFNKDGKLEDKRKIVKRADDNVLY
ncbi:hypothetical protein C9994_04205 [Marivirga lumbricoides]|uniref:PepSY domain-containing protein n=1 Tax=Marivirga lumbricoides TaxID=1046115 RepID=A0A2T4DTJ7_9BACT|nr:hypothetical protein C9994_04205 [Marivirga lumbricoides]